MAKKLKINKKISPFNRTAYKDRSIGYIVIHYVGAVSKAKDNANYFYTAYRGASAHYFVDDAAIWQAVEDKNAAWHCGGGLQGSGGHTFHGKCMNRNSIGIEMCCKKKNGKLYITDKTIAMTAKLVRYLMDKHNVPAGRVIRHYDVTGKICPEPYIKESAWKKLHQTLTGEASKETAYPTADLKKGSKGEQAKKLQKCLNKLDGAGLEVDGIFGEATLKAVKKFQKKHGLEADGIVGEKTRAKIKQLVG